ncbi:MAG: adenylyl-sulfate kinase [Pseudomonadota bacterium]
MTKNLTAVSHTLNAADRAGHYGHRGAVLWLTGLSASGKSTLSMALEHALMARGYSCYVLDGDNVRNGLNANLGFKPEDRTENIRRVGEVAALFADAGLICISAFISPYRADRASARQACRETFHEIHIATDLATCEARDPKGLYKQARSGTIAEFTGISAPYEPPEQPELVLDTSGEAIEASLQKLVAYVVDTIPLLHKSTTQSISDRI